MKNEEGQMKWYKNKKLFKCWACKWEGMMHEGYRCPHCRTKGMRRVTCTKPKYGSEED